MYNQLLRHGGQHEISPDFIELCYLTLMAWGMNSRRAKLVCFSEFDDMINKHKNSIIELRKYSITDIHHHIYLQEEISNLFHNITISKCKTKIVSTSKLLHFVLPNTLVPIDWRYTLTFFNVYPSSISEGEIYLSIQKQFSQFAYKKKLSHLIGSEICPNIPKAIDNLLIAHIKKNRLLIL
ncbi:MAG: hypothetical protein WC150_02215 [Bacteroidia bacterium]